MRNYSYQNKWQKLLTPEIVSLLTQIHEYKGKQELYLRQKPVELGRLIEIAKIQSTEASNKIEGIFTSDERLKKLVSNKTTPRTRNEQEIAGYRDVLNTIHENYEYIPTKESDEYSTLLLALEMTARGYSFLPIDIEKSDYRDFLVTEDKMSLIIPFKALESLGENVEYRYGKRKIRKIN